MSGPAWCAPRAAPPRPSPPADHCCGSLECLFLLRHRCPTGSMPKWQNTHAQGQPALASWRQTRSGRPPRCRALCCSLWVEKQPGRASAAVQDAGVLVCPCSKILSPAPAQLGAATLRLRQRTPGRRRRPLAGASCQHRSAACAPVFTSLSPYRLFTTARAPTGGLWPPFAFCQPILSPGQNAARCDPTLVQSPFGPVRILFHVRKPAKAP